MLDPWDEVPVLSFLDWDDDLDELVGGVLELYLRNPQGGAYGHLRGTITAIRLSTRGQFVVELEDRRSFHQQSGKWVKTGQLERLMHPNSKPEHLGMILGPYILDGEDDTIFWTFGKRPHDPEQCLWIFPKDATVPDVPFEEDDVRYFIARFVEVADPGSLEFKDKPKRRQS